MPELPEVEIFKRFAEAHAGGKPIRAARVGHPKILEGVSPDALVTALEDHRLETFERRGKNLFARIEPGGPWLTMHFGMTGFLAWQERNGDTLISAYGDEEKGRHVRLRLDYDDGSLLLDEQRMFGKVGLVDDLDAYLARRKLGPDALAISQKDFLARLEARNRGQTKPLLMDQSFVAGVGNVYADEILFQCGLHPERPLSSLSGKDRQCLHEQMIAVLEATVSVRADRGQLPGHYLTRHRHPNGRCPNDKTRLDIITVGGRTTYFCPACQTL